MWRSYASQLPPGNWNVDAKLVQMLTKGTIRDCADMNTELAELVATIGAATAVAIVVIGGLGCRC